MATKELASMQAEGYCGCGCGEIPPIAHKSDKYIGWVRGKPRPYVPYHHHRKSPVDYIVDDNGCWVWQRNIQATGYARAYDKATKTQVFAHRLFYARHNGPIPNGMHIDHLCFNKRCVNPDHLEAVTQAENNRRSWRRRGY